MNGSILIIGTETGLGLGLTESYLSQGWSVFATHRPAADTASLAPLKHAYCGQLTLGQIDVTQGEQIAPLMAQLGQRTFDVMVVVAGIYGPLHQSVLQATDEEFQQVMMTNAFGPARLARHLLEALRPRGALVFISSHRASIAANTEPGLGLELYRASKAALNMLARCVFMDIQSKGQTVISLHPGWVATAMGTLDGAVAAEIDIATSVRGMARVIERHLGDNQHLFLDYQDNPWPW